MAFSAVATGIGALMAGAASATGAATAIGRTRKQRKFQEKILKQSQEYQKDYSKFLSELESERNAEYWQKYNSPSAQRAAMRAAGINPFVEGSVIQPSSSDASVSGTSSPSLPDPADYSGEVFSNLQAGGSTLFQMSQQSQLTEAEVSLKNAQRAKLESETIAQNNQNSLFPLLRSSSEMDYLSKRYRTEIDRVQAEIAPYLGQLQTEEGRAKVAEIWASAQERLEAAAKTSADRQNAALLLKAQIPQIEASTENLKADTTLKGEQAKTEGSKRSNLDAQTQTENETREGRVREITERINTLMADADLSSEKSRTEVYNRVVDALGLSLPDNARQAAAREIVYGRRNSNAAYLKLSTHEVNAMLDKYAPKKK